MIRSAVLLAVLALSACAPRVPDSGSGVGFGKSEDFSGYRDQRDAELNGAAPSGASTTGTAPDATGAAPAENTASVAAPDPNNPTISDEQDFDAVTNRQSIESDAERLRAQRDAYQVIAPTAVPTRAGNSGPNIVQYALSTSNPVGQKVYRRSIVSTQKKTDRNCAGYASSDLAQEAFLKAGGPDRDKMALDPDGDGFACAWDPTPFRRIGASNG